MLPYLGCAQEMDQIAPSWLEGGVSARASKEEGDGERGGTRLFGGGRKGDKYPLRVSVRRCESPSTSKILTVRSEEQVARRRP
jgi:hypothetical protein